MGTAKQASRLWLGGFDRLNVLLPGAGTAEAVSAMSIRLAGLFVVAGVLLVVRVLSALFGVRLLHARSPEVLGEQRRGSVGVRQFSMSSAKPAYPSAYAHTPASTCRAMLPAGSAAGDYHDVARDPGYRRPSAGSGSIVALPAEPPSCTDR